MLVPFSLAALLWLYGSLDFWIFGIGLLRWVVVWFGIFISFSNITCGLAFPHRDCNKTCAHLLGGFLWGVSQLWNGERSIKGGGSLHWVGFGGLAFVWGECAVDYPRKVFFSVLKGLCSEEIKVVSKALRK